MFKDGFNGYKLLFMVYVILKVFYEVLKEVGGMLGENMMMDNKEMIYVIGSKLDILVNW